MKTYECAIILFAGKHCRAVPHFLIKVSILNIVLQTCTDQDVTLHVSPTNPAIFLYQKFGFKVSAGTILIIFIHKNLGFFGTFNAIFELYIMSHI